MHIITIDGKEDAGAYSVQNELGEDVLYIFEEEDDAVRYAMMLEDKGYPEMHVIEVEPATMIAMCETHEYERSQKALYLKVHPNQKTADRKSL